MLFWKYPPGLGMPPKSASIYVFIVDEQHQEVGRLLSIKKPVGRRVRRIGATSLVPPDVAVARMYIGLNELMDLLHRYIVIIISHTQEVQNRRKSPTSGMHAISEWSQNW